jgi:hypothetical protein
MTTIAPVDDRIMKNPDNRFPNLFSTIQSNDYGYLKTTKFGAMYALRTSSQTISNTQSAVSFEQVNWNNLINITDAGTSFQYVGDKPFIRLLLSVNTTLLKSSIDVLFQFRVFITDESIPRYVSTIYANSDFGNPLSFTTIILLEKGKKLQLRAITNGTTVLLAPLPDIGGTSQQSITMSMVEIPTDW